jgi:hypothetical protein
MGSSAGCIVGIRARRSRAHEPVQGSGSRPESARGVCGGSLQNYWVTLLSHKTKTGGSTSGDGIRARREASMPEDTQRDRGLASRGRELWQRRVLTVNCGKGVC